MFEYTICVKIEYTDIYLTKKQLKGEIGEFKQELNDGLKEAIEKETGVKFDDFSAEVKVFERELDISDD